ncbi:hypothetical protein IMZ31_22665 (plasmid) [Pontibacillus sp. ALD_SL1]|uniref:hypothetical protein n=1 Tax=Pontibacillus sp. ALD_SL1 TaxID=2777185 RepID=UPI001A958191|nr:hypothetical protein [Pontibacillus sp. ALD_SL1]QST02260.1 hypothetical protein IMZ31_22665 [Pontibacillus sp. ALD_SL1]
MINLLKQAKNKTRAIKTLFTYSKKEQKIMKVYKEGDLKMLKKEKQLESAETFIYDSNIQNY